MDACRWLLQQGIHRGWGDFILECTSKEVREACSSLFLVALKKVVVAERQNYGNNCVVDQFLLSVVKCLLKGWDFWRHLETYFGFLREVAAIGTEERQILLDQSLVAELSAFVCGDESPSLAGDLVFTYPSVDTQLVQPQLAAMMDLMSTLVCGSICPGAIEDSHTFDASPLRLPGVSANIPLPDWNELFSNELTFFSTLLRYRVNVEMTCRVLAHCCWKSSKLSKQALDMILVAFEEFDADAFPGFFSLLSTLLVLEDIPVRVGYIMPKLMECLRSNSQYSNPTDVSIQHLLKLSHDNRKVSTWLVKHAVKWPWIEEYLTDSSPRLI